MTTNHTGGVRNGRESTRGRRRGQCETTLAAIRTRSGPLTLSELVEIIADRRPSALVAPSDGRDPEESVRIRLHHVLLPKLQKRGEIEYDPARHLIS